MSTAIGTRTDRVGATFLTAFWLPAFVPVLAGLGMGAALVGPDQVGVWATDLDAVEQRLAVLTRWPAAP
jgi:hypothetical protein